MSRGTRRPGILRAMVIAVTIVFSSIALVVGQPAAEEPVRIRVGQPAPQTFVATADHSVVDQAETDAQRQRAFNNVPTVFRQDQAATNKVINDLSGFFEMVRAVAEPDPPPPTTTTVPEPTTTTEPPTGTEEEQGTGGEETTTTSTTTSTTTTTLPPPRDIEEQRAMLLAEYPLLATETRDTMLKLHNDDFQRAQEEEPLVFLPVAEETLREAERVLGVDGGILLEDLDDVRNQLVTRPRPVLLPPVQFEEGERAAIAAAVADLVATNLLANREVDDAATNAARQEAADAVDPVEVGFVEGQTIVEEGEVIAEVHRLAIEDLNLIEPPEQPRLEAMAIAAALAVVLATLFLWRVAERHWERPKLVALFGLLVVLAALASRVPEIFPDDRADLGYLIPAAVFGYLAAILFEPRTALLMVIPVGTFTGLATGDLGLTVFAVGATMAPVPFVSSVSTRTQLRLAVLYSAAVIAPLAGAVAWFLSGPGIGQKAMAIGFANGVASGILALGILPFLENLFRITTTLTLLDLTDRNHPALRLIEEEAPGTFNHSILVGTLAGKAARAIDGDPLLAQAAAYYHDLGKTVHPQYFIENQFGVSNPHDEMDPAESVDVIRAHVTNGLRLAKQYGIPAEVAQGIVMHHGTGFMRFFYHKAMELDSGADPDVYRHRGEKPEAKEMAILMLSDSVEGAVRALVQHEDPTSDGIRKLVDQVVTEKVDDGQLDESSITFGQLTRVKEALVDALIGYYHTRIPYPGFPGTESRVMRRA